MPGCFGTAQKPKPKKRLDLTSNDIIAGDGMISGLEWLCIVVVNYQRQHYVLKFNSFDAVQCDAIARPCFVIQ